MLKKILLGLGILVGLIVLAVVGMSIYAGRKVEATYNPPLPKITRATSPEAIARGKMIFMTTCASCHADDSGRMVGRPFKDLPPALGEVYTANLTSDPEGGVGAWKDEEIARMIVQSIDKDGKVRPMIGLPNMSDEDIAAVIGFMRSGDPVFEPVKEHPPHSKPTWLGNIVTAVVFGINDKAHETVTAPPRGPTAEYGKYAATALYDCYFCHTEGFSGNKLNEPGLFAGGFEYDLAPLGMEGKIYTPNITPHPTAGIGSWSVDDFKRALHEGVAKDGTILRPPMAKYRYLDDVELEAIFAYLKTVPPSDKPTKPSTFPRAKASPSSPPDQLFSTLGCEFCHGANRQFTAKIKNAKGKTPEEVAKWIRNPESFKPGTQMPSYAALLDEGQSVELAKWVLSTKANAP